MEQIKTMTIFGTRPEVIKLAPVIQQLSASPAFNSVLVTTGQHREMLGQALDQFGIVPHYNLDIMQENQGVSDVTVNSLAGVEELIVQEQPDLVIVQGDTTSAFAGCLAAFYQKVPVAHVEAGLRTYDKYRPFPEEINRSLITQLADIHFVPTETAWQALRREGISEDKIFITGNTVIDALFQVVKSDYHFTNQKLNKLRLDGRRLILVTSHRRENLGQPIKNICNGIKDLVARFSDIEVVFSVHRNPKVAVPVREILGRVERVHLVDPLNYLDMANLLNHSYLVLTDSGGLQEEAPALGKPVLVMRDVTERPEAVLAGLARIIGTSRQAIFSGASAILQDPSIYASMSQGFSPYGDGMAASRIISAIEYSLGLRANKPAPYLNGIPMSVTGDQLVNLSLNSEAFYRQLDERIARARQECQQVSVATLNMKNAENEVFADAVRTITRSLRKTDTAAALEGKNLVLVLPGDTEEQARMTTDRLIAKLSASNLSRRSTDRQELKLLKNITDYLSVNIKTYAEDSDTGSCSQRPKRGMAA